MISVDTTSRSATDEYLLVVDRIPPYGRRSVSPAVRREHFERNPWAYLATFTWYVLVYHEVMWGDGTSRHRGLTGRRPT